MGDALWRVGKKLGRTLYCDEVFMGILDSPEVAAEIVETMNARSQFLADMELLRNPPPGVMEKIDAYVLGAPESGRERSPDPYPSGRTSATAGQREVWCIRCSSPGHIEGNCPP